MKRYIVVLFLALFLASTIVPAFAQDKRAENNRKIADFIADTVKLPYVLMGAFIRQNHDEAKQEMDYKEHKGIYEALNKQEPQAAK